MPPVGTDPAFPVTRLLRAASDGDRDAGERLLRTVYQELRGLARSQLARGPASPTLHATALVNEAYVRLLGRARPAWENRRHFFFAAARAMRDVLVEEARRKGAQARGGGWARVDLESLELALDTPPAAILSLDEALSRLEARAPDKAELVRLRFYAGLSEAETASVLGVSKRTVSRAWQFARAFLYAELTDGASGDPA
jgi:RNA polymerase sigma factor (TIGR02999 family)